MAAVTGTFFVLGASGTGLALALGVNVMYRLASLGGTLPTNHECQIRPIGR